MRKFATAVPLSLLVGSGFAKSTDSKVIEPPILGKVFLVSAPDLKQLPEDPFKSTDKRGWASISGVVEISGDHSSLRIPAGSSPEFVFDLSNPDQVKLYACVVKGKNRQFTTAVLKGGATRLKEEQMDGLPVTVAHYGQSSFKLTPNAALAPGEYAVVAAGKMFTFGID
jgi:hypothetical protein